MYSLLSARPVKPLKMPRGVQREGEEELVDLTEALALRSKRTERRRRKRETKDAKSRSRGAAAGLLNLPYEITMHILTMLRPSDVFCLSRTNKAFSFFVQEQEETLVRDITAARYACLSRCFRVPVLLKNMEPALCRHLKDAERHDKWYTSQRGFQHIAAWDKETMCSCGSCILRWNTLCVAVDFAHWQDDLDKGKPLPTIARGRNPQWNQRLVESHAAVVRKAFTSRLWHARILEAHLDSTIRSIRRHAENKGNRRLRFRMTKADERAESDAFLERAGPPSVDVPWHRDNYYLLEAYLPNRAWFMGPRDWVYVPADQHDRDVELVVRWSQSRDRQASQASTA